MTEEEAINLLNNAAPGSDMLSTAIRGLGRSEFKINRNKGKSVEESLRIANAFLGEKLMEISESIKSQL